LSKTSKEPPAHAKKLSAGGWVDLARAIRAATRDLPYGDRSEGIDTVARIHGLTGSAARRALLALGFLDFVNTQDTELAQGLTRAPMFAVEHLARWHRHSPDISLKAAVDLVAGRHTVRSLEAAERKARREAPEPANRGRGLVHAHRDQAPDILRPLISDELEIIGRPHGRLSLPADLLVRKRSNGELGAILLVGPYRDPKLYRNRATDWLMKAVALLSLKHDGEQIHHVHLVVDRAEIASEYRTWLDHFGIRGVTVVNIGTGDKNQHTITDDDALHPQQLLESRQSDRDGNDDLG